MANAYDKDQKHTAKKAINFILSFLVFVFLTCITLLSCLYLNLFEPHTVLKAVEQSGFVAGTKTQFEENAWDTTIPLGLPKEIVVDLVSLEQVRQDITTGVQSMLANKPYAPDNTGLRGEIATRVAAYFSAQGTVLSDQQTKVLKQYQDTLAADYANLTSIPLLNYCGSIKAAYGQLVVICLIVLAVFLVACVAFILLLQRFKHRGLRYLIYATISAAVATGILPVLSFATGFHGGISISPAYLKLFVVGYMDQCLYMLLAISIFFMLVTAVLFVMIHLAKRNLENKKREKNRVARRASR